MQIELAEKLGIKFCMLHDVILESVYACMHACMYTYLCYNFTLRAALTHANSLTLDTQAQAHALVHQRENTTKVTLNEYIYSRNATVSAFISQ